MGRGEGAFFPMLGRLPLQCNPGLIRSDGMGFLNNSGGTVVTNTGGAKKLPAIVGTIWPQDAGFSDN